MGCLSGEGKRPIKHKSNHSDADNEFSHFPGHGSLHIIPEHSDTSPSDIMTIVLDVTIVLAIAINIGVAVGKETA